MAANPRSGGLEGKPRNRPAPAALARYGRERQSRFHWTASDFSLMDAIECGMVKLPRVPVSDNIPGEEMPVYRNLWEHIGKNMPRKGRANAGALNPADLPSKLRTALETLYGCMNTP